MHVGPVLNLSDDLREPLNLIVAGSESMHCVCRQQSDGKPFFDFQPTRCVNQLLTKELVSLGSR